MSFTPEQITEILQIYFDNFVSQTYTGMRYVPIIGRRGESSAAWDNTAPYEPLTIVTYNDESYTSRQFVPAAVAITDTDYWVKTGAYNAQIVALQDALPIAQFDSENTVKDYIDELGSFLPASDFDNDNTVKAYIDGFADLLPSSAFDSVNTVRGALNGRVRAFETVADMAAATDLVEDMICHTNGFHTSGDGGAAFYEIKNTGTANAMDIIACQDSLLAHLVIENQLNIKQIGANSSNNDNSSIINHSFDLSKNIYIPNETFNVTNKIYILSDTKIICDGTININCDSSTEGVINILSKENIEWTGGNINGTGSLTTLNANKKVCFYIYDSEYILLQNIRFSNIPEVWTICSKANNEIKILGCTFDDYTHTGIGFLTKSTNIKVNNNILGSPKTTNDPSTYPITLNSYDTVLSSEQEVSENIECCNNIINCSSNPWWEGIDAHGGKNIIISNNILIGCFVGIAILSDSNNYFKSENVNIINNIIIGPTVAPTRSTNNAGITGGGNNFIISNNKISNYGQFGANSNTSNGGILFARVCNNITIANNDISNIDGVGIEIGGKNCKVIGNNISFSNTSRFSVTFFLYIYDTAGQDEISIDVSNNTISNVIRYTNGLSDSIGNYKCKVIFKDNNSNSYVCSNRVWQIMDKYVDKPNSLGVKAGIKGMYAFNYEPTGATNNIWLCTASATANDPATWTQII